MIIKKKGVWDKCKKGKYSVTYDNKTAKVRRRLVWNKEDG